MLAKKHNLYGKDIKAGYEDDWAIDTFGDIFKRDFYPLWFKDEVTDEEIKGARKKFAKWNRIVDQKLGQLGTPFIGGNKPTVGDFVIFAIYADMVLNEHTFVPELRNALKPKLE